MLRNILLANPADEKLYVEDVFSTTLYTGNAGNKTVTTGVNITPSAAWDTSALYQGNSTGYAVTSDSSGNYYLAGRALDTTFYGLVAKYDSTGALVWQRKIQQGSTAATGIAVDASGNVFVTGQANDGQLYVFVAKYNSSGVLQWQRKIRELSIGLGGGVAIDSAGNVCITGTLNDGTRNYMWTAKYNTSGALQWQRKLYQNNSAGNKIAVNSSDEVLVVGQANDATRNYILIAKYNSSGTIQWQRKIYQNSSNGLGIAVDSSSNVYIVGTANDGADYLLTAKYGTSGTLAWQRKFRFYGAIAAGIDVDSAGNVYVIGSDWNGSNDGWVVAEYNTTGALQWQRRLNQGDSYGSGIKVDSLGYIYLTGRAYNSTLFVDYAPVVRLKSDGSTKSGTALLTLRSGIATDVAGTATDAAGTATAAAASATDAAGTLTDSAGTATAISAAQAATVENGLVWIKSRSAATDHAVYDTVRGVTLDIATNTTGAQTTQATGITDFATDGFTVNGLAKINTNAATYAAWTFRKARKFFDVLTYTGDGATLYNRWVDHSLGTVPGMVIVKCTSTTSNWGTWCRLNDTTVTYNMYLNTTAASASSLTLNQHMTATSFRPPEGFNVSGATYVAYLFAHDATADGIVQCGSYTGNGSTTGPTITLGWEPQFILIKPSSAVQSWYIYDTQRGIGTGFADKYSTANSTTAELSAELFEVTQTGFRIRSNATIINGASTTYFYVAIRRGLMRAPTDATKVFKPVARTGTGTVPWVASGAGFPPDMTLMSFRSQVNSFTHSIIDRLRRCTEHIQTINNNAEGGGWGDGHVHNFDGYDGLYASDSSYFNTSGVTFVDNHFRRATSFFDVICYTGTGVDPTQITHNLGVAPELIIVKRRNSAGNWRVGGTGLTPGGSQLVLNSTAAAASAGTSAIGWTATAIEVYSGTDTNANGSSYVAYLFASCPGVSKVGNYTGNGASLDRDCGFTNGARFVLIKRIDSTGDWYFWDSARGIVAGNDPHLSLNSTAAEVTTNDSIDPLSSGFRVNQVAATNVNVYGGSYIFLAIA